MAFGDFVFVCWRVSSFGRVNGEETRSLCGSRNNILKSVIKGENEIVPFCLSIEAQFNMSWHLRLVKFG